MEVSIKKSSLNYPDLVSAGGLLAASAPDGKYTRQCGNNGLDLLIADSEYEKIQPTLLIWVIQLNNTRRKTNHEKPAQGNFVGQHRQLL
jgi:hypothetical protein